MPKITRPAKLYPEGARGRRFVQGLIDLSSASYLVLVVGLYGPVAILYAGLS